MSDNHNLPTQTGESPFDAGRIPCPQGGEDRWSARWLMDQMGYDKWERFEGVIERAKSAAHNQTFNPNIHFTVNRENVTGEVLPGAGKNLGGRPRVDYSVTRFAAYLIAMNGDPRKSEVAAAQAYFAVKTREAETAAPALVGAELIAAALIESQRVIESREARIYQLEQKVTADAPKVGYIDQFVADEDLMKLRAVAGNLEVQEKWLRALLIEKRWIYSETTTRFSQTKGEKEVITRYSAYADKKRYFRPVERHEAPRFKGEVMHTLKVTPSGAEAIARLVSKEAA